MARHFALHTISNIEEYKRKVPLTSFADYEEFSKDVYENGTEDVFFRGRADYIAVSSGTTSGVSKRFPKSLTIMRATSGRWVLASQKCLLDVKNNGYLRKWLCVRPASKTWLSAAGVRTGPISGISGSYSLNPYSAPSWINNLHSAEDVIYLNLVFGVKHPDICNLFFPTSHMAFRFFQVLERRWKEVCSDIERGTISKRLLISNEIKQRLIEALGGGDSSRANVLRHEFKQGFKDIVPRLWPECPGLFCLATGAFQTQVRN